MVAGGDAEAGVAVHDEGGFGGDGDVAQQRRHQPGPHRRAVDGGDGGLAAVDQVIDQVPSLLPGVGQGVVVLGHLLDHLEVPSGGKRLAFAGEDHAVDVLVRVHLPPDIGKLPVAGDVQGVVPFRPADADAQNAFGGIIELQALIALVWHGVLSSVGRMQFSRMGTLVATRFFYEETLT